MVSCEDSAEAMASGDHEVRVRYSFLVPNQGLSPEQFRAHYRDIHGPLAAAQPGFRKYTQRYVQNHVRVVLREGLIQAAGITATTQIPREDFSVGFFDEEDYANVQKDELFLFDIELTCSVLGRKVAGEDRGGAGAATLLALSPRWPLEDFDKSNCVGEDARDWSVFELDYKQASALGFGGSHFSAKLLIHARFDDDATAYKTLENHPEWTEAWLVDEIEIFALP